MELKNASQFPRIFLCRHMNPGLCGYENETVLVDTDALKKMIPSAYGLPVYINHQNVDLDKMQEQACGYISRSFYNELDGWLWFEFLAINDEAHDAIAKGWSVSNAYRPTEWGPSGTKNNVPYDREVTNGKFTHLAIVANPRYEEACIMTKEAFADYQQNKERELKELQNSKTLKGNTMFKIFKNTKEEITSVDENSILNIPGLGDVSVKELINAKKNADEKTKMNDDDMVDVENESMPLKELINRYNSMKKNEVERKNADDATAKEKAKEAEDKKNADDAAEKKKKDDEAAADKENSKFFEELKNAHLAGNKEAVTVEAPQNKLQRGKARYGSGA